MKLDVILRLIVAVPTLFLVVCAASILPRAVMPDWMALFIFLLLSPVFLLVILWILEGNRFVGEIVSAVVEDCRFRFRRMKQKVTMQHSDFGDLTAREHRWVGAVDTEIMGPDTVFSIAPSGDWISSADDSPSKEQFQILHDFLLNEASSRDSIAQTIYRVYCECRDVASEYESIGRSIAEDSFPSIDSASDVWEHLMSGSIEIPPPDFSSDTGVILCLNWLTDWDIEHGLHVLLGSKNDVLEAYME